MIALPETSNLMTMQEPNKCSKIKDFTKRALKAPFVFIAICAVCICIVGLLLTGQAGKFNLGGLLGKILGHVKKEDPQLLDANTIPSGRAQELGEVDRVGQKQVKVEDYQPPLNPFRDKTVLTVPSSHSQQGSIKVKLPEGLQDTDISKVVVLEGGGQTHVQVVRKPARNVLDTDLTYFD